MLRIAQPRRPSELPFVPSALRSNSVIPALPAPHKSIAVSATVCNMAPSDVASACAKL